MKRLLIFGVLFNCYLFTNAQTNTQYPDIPRIDVHTHVSNDYEAIGNYLNLRDRLQEDYSVDFAFWINLSSYKDPIHNVDSVMLVSENRSLACFADYKGHKGITHKPEELQGKLDEGYVGYKIWYGTKTRVLEPGEKGYPYLDDPYNEPMLDRMEEMGVVAASLHIADPNGPYGNRTEWCPDPVEYWRMIRAFTNVMERHPNLVVVGAHGLWLVCQDAQLDYLRYLFATYPNLYVDLAATFQYYDMVNPENLRSFMIENADRILYGTDAGQWHSEDEVRNWAKAYWRTFQILETDQLVEGSFFGNEPIKGLNLPREVLEKIYYKNALKIYPRLMDKMKTLGYDEK